MLSGGKGQWYRKASRRGSDERVHYHREKKPYKEFARGKVGGESEYILLGVLYIKQAINRNLFRAGA